MKTVEKATEICKNRSVSKAFVMCIQTFLTQAWWLKRIAVHLQVNEVRVEVIEGDPRDVICQAVDKYHASILVVGSHGYGAFKRYFSFTICFCY